MLLVAKWSNCSPKMNPNLKKYCSTVSLVATAQLGRIDPALNDTNFWFVPALCFAILFLWDVNTKDKVDRKREFFGTDYGYTIIYSIAIAMFISGIVLSYTK